MSDHPNFTKAFTENFLISPEDEASARLFTQKIGTLTVDDEGISVLDPLMEFKPRKLSVDLPTGEWPISVCLLRRPQDEVAQGNPGRVAAARLGPVAGPPVRWDRAVTKSKSGKETKAKATVESTRLAFATWGAAEKLSEMDELARDLAFTDGLAYPRGGGHEVVSFEPGLGAGNYDLWVGTDSYGTVTTIEIDCELLRTQVWEQVSFDLVIPNRMETPELRFLEILRTIEVWKSKPYDTTKAVVLQVESGIHQLFSKVDPRLEIRVTDAQGKLIPCQEDSVYLPIGERSGFFRKFESTEPFPPGAKILVRVCTQTRMLE